MKTFRNFILKLLLRHLDDLLVEIYSSSNRTARAYLLSPVFALRRLVLFLISGLSFQLFLIHGNGADTQEPMTVAYFREGRGMDYLAGCLFHGGQYRQEFCESIPFWKVGERAQAIAKEVDLVVVERNTILKWTPASGEWVSAPTWVRMVIDVDLGSDWSGVERTFKKQERNIRRFRRSEYSYCISKRIEDFHFFYERMYIPLLRQRHTNDAHIDTREHLLQYFQRGFLLLILDRDGNPVAADLDYVNGDMLFGIACGVLDGNPAILEEGALSAIYYYTLQWCHENRVPRCDICEVRPFVNDGVYQYKRRWGYEPTRELWNPREWLLWVPKSTSPAAAWIHEHPFLPEFARRGSLSTPGMKKLTNLPSR